MYMKQDSDITQSSSLRELGRYRVLRRIGVGGMGDVWLAEDPSLHRQVAIKTLPTHSQHDYDFSLRFAREAQAAAALNHPHILSIHDFGEQPLSNGQSITYIVMPYISGGSLADKIAAYIDNNTGISAQEAIFYLQQAAAAIDYAHSQGVVHRDIKPANMLLRPDNWLLLADFGIARMLANQEKMTHAGVGIGTPEYMAPEQAQGKAEAASDNYSLAVIAYQLFTGHLPFIAETGYAITVQHMITLPPSPREYNPHLSSAFEAVLLQGLAKEPQERPSSARAFIAELEQALNNAASDPTYVKPPLSTTRVGSMSVPDGRGMQSKLSGDITHVHEKYKGITRRQVLIGGGAAGVLALGGITWVITASTHTHSNTQSTPVTGNTTVTVASSPGDPTLVLTGHDKPITSLSWSPKANTLMSAGAEGSIFAWDIEALAQQKGQPPLPLAKQTFTADDKIFVAWSPDGNAVAIGNAAGDINANTSSIYVYQKDLRASVQGYDKPILVPGVISIHGLGWAMNKYIVTLDMPIDFITKSQFHLRLWDTTQPLLQLQPATLLGNFDTSFNSNLKLLATSPKQNFLVALALSTGAMVGEVSVSGKAVRWHQRSAILPILENTIAQDVDGITWSSSGNFVVGFYQDLAAKSIINGWRWQDKNPTPAAVTVPDDDPVLTTLATCTAPSSTLIAAGGKKGTVYIWDVNKGTEPVQVLHGAKASNAAVGALEWSADGKWLAASYQDVQASILIWNVNTLNM